MDIIPGAVSHFKMGCLAAYPDFAGMTAGEALAAQLSLSPQKEREIQSD